MVLILYVKLIMAIAESQIHLIQRDFTSSIKINSVTEKHINYKRSTQYLSKRLTVPLLALCRVLLIADLHANGNDPP